MIPNVLQAPYARMLTTSPALTDNRKENFYPDYLFTDGFLEKILFQREMLAFCLTLDTARIGF